MAQILVLQTEDGTHHLPCPTGARLMVGSAEDADIVLLGEAVPKRHAILERLAERCFRISAVCNKNPCTVNGVTTVELEVDVPFRFAAGGNVIVMDLVSEAGCSMQPSRRRDYLLGPIRLRPRVRLLSPLPESDPAIEPGRVSEGLRLISRSRFPADFSQSRAVPVEMAKVTFSKSNWTRAAVVIAVTSLAGAGWISHDALQARILEEPRPLTSTSENTMEAAAEGKQEAPRPAMQSSQSLLKGAPSPDLKTVAQFEASGHVRAFILSWNDASAPKVLEYVNARSGRYFEIPNPSPDAVLRLEEDFRTRWPHRVIQLKGEAVAIAMSEKRAEVLQRFEFELTGMNRVACGDGELRCTVERDRTKSWRISSAADHIEVKNLKPVPAAFTSALSLRGLKPALSMEERLQAATEELNALVKAGDAKACLKAILKAASAFPQEAFWRHGADRVCTSLAVQLFRGEEWDDATCVNEVTTLSDAGLASATLLLGHLMSAGYSAPRHDAQGELMYRKAYEQGRSREARFYHAEALFVRGEIDKASALALAAMSSSTHPLEAYLAGHLLWKKAEIDPALWQQVYETVARVADRHPPARNLAGLVLIKHGQTRKEREAGFKLIQQAAEAGVVEAMKNLGACHDIGNGCERNPAEAEKWKTKAATSKPPSRKHYSEFEGG